MSAEQARKILKSYADQNGLQRLAQRLGCSKGHASYVCSGKRRLGLSLAVKAQAIFGIPPAAWL